MVRCGSKNGYKKDMCLKRIGLHAQNILTILGLIGNIIGDLLDCVMAPIFLILEA
jgi:hypothetical protein